MIVDCQGCVMRDVACGDCVVTFLLGPPEGIGSAEQVALAALADGGLVPPLRMRPAAAGDRPRASPTAGRPQRTGRQPGAASA
jgi:hypothetical protein